MINKTGIPKCSEAANGALFLNTFCYRKPPLAASHYFAKFSGKLLYESVL